MTAPSRINTDTISVLVVTENQFMRSLVSEVLRGYGVYRLFTARDGKDAIREINEFHPKIVIVDAELPDTTGIEFTREIRKGKCVPNRAVHIIMLSTVTSVDSIKEARLAGVSEFLAKPISNQALWSRIEECILRPRKFVSSPKYTGPCRRRRGDIDYTGARRRLSDPLEGVVADPIAEAKRVAVQEGLALISGLAANLNLTDRATTRKLYAGACDTHDHAVASKDDMLARSTGSLVKYIEGMGTNYVIETDVIATHVAAIQRLLASPDADEEIRNIVAKGLEQIVDRKLASVAETFVKVLDGANKVPPPAPRTMYDQDTVLI